MKTKEDWIEEEERIVKEVEAKQKRKDLEITGLIARLLSEVQVRIDWNYITKDVIYTASWRSSKRADMGFDAGLRSVSGSDIKKVMSVVVEEILEEVGVEQDEKDQTN